MVVCCDRRMTSLLFVCAVRLFWVPVELAWFLEIGQLPFS
jgi:hypothetical protein